MPTTATKAQRHQERWQEIADDPALEGLPYKIETNARGQIVLSPPKAQHSDLQGRVLDMLRDVGSEGRGMPEFPIATEGGVRVPDVVWVPGGRLEELTETGDPPTRAPDVCVEVMSDSNDEDEMHEKRALYLSAGALEVWIVGQDGTVRFYTDEGKVAASNLIPDFPDQL
jgi:Uma2 family endonuclease